MKRLCPTCETWVSLPTVIEKNLAAISGITMTTQHDERAMLIERLTFLANSDSGLSVIAQDTCRKAAAMLAADSRAGGEPVAWLKEWDSVGHAMKGLRRVDLTPECEPWLAAMCPTITPLYTHPQPQAVAQGWKLDRVTAQQGDGGSPGVRVTRPDGCTHVFWRDGWRGKTSGSDVAAFDLLNTMLSAPPAAPAETQTRKDQP